MAQDVANIGFGCCTMARIWRLYAVLWSSCCVIVGWVCVVWGEGLLGKLYSYLGMASINCSVVSISSGRVHRI